MKQKIFLLIALLCAVAQGAWAQASLTTDGSGNYTIGNETDWGVFCDLLAGGESFSGKVVKLSDTWDNSTSAITATVGTEANPFQGMFDGNGKTLNVNINDDSGIQGTAPFRNIAGATIKNLKVVGSVTGSTHSAGLVGLTSSGNNTIVNCIVSADVSITNSSIGNFVGGIVGFACDATLNMTGCVFNGSLSLVEPYNYYTNFYYAGGLIGWCGVDGHGNPNTAPTLNIINCVSTGTYYNYAADHFHPIIVKWDGITVNSENITNTFYTGNPTVTSYSYSDHYVNAGTKAYSVTPNVPLDYGKATVYNVSGITGYANGIEYDGKYYTGSGTVVSFGAHAGYTLSDVTYNDGNGAQTLTPDVSGLYSFTMPANDVTITATRTPSDNIALTANPADGNYWTTFYNGTTSFTADANTTVYKAAMNGTSSLTLTAVANREIPSGQAVILKSSSANITLTQVASTTADLSGNVLMGGTEVSAGYDAYTLSRGSAGTGTVGFYKFNGSSLNGNRAHLEIEQGASAPAFIGFGDGGTTAIEAPTATIIVEDGETYDLTGRRIEGQPTRKGIYVKNGQKFIVK